jgi:hypothetical protein
MNNNQQILIEQIAKISAEVATQATIEYLNKVKLEEQRTKQDRRLHNTKLLLRNYRSFKVHCNDIREELSAEKETSVMEELEQNEFAVEAIKRSKERTLAMVRFIDQMLQVYKTLCEQSDKLEDRRKHDTIYDLFISMNKKTYEQVAECQNRNVRTVYRDVNDAVKSLSVLVFGVDGIRLIG